MPVLDSTAGKREGTAGPTLSQHLEEVSTQDVPVLLVKLNSEPVDPWNSSVLHALRDSCKFLEVEEAAQLAVNIS